MAASVCSSELFGGALRVRRFEIVCVHVPYDGQSQCNVTCFASMHLTIRFCVERAQCMCNTYASEQAPLVSDTMGRTGFCAHRCPRSLSREHRRRVFMCAKAVSGIAPARKGFQMSYVMARSMRSGTSFLGIARAEDQASSMCRIALSQVAIAFAMRPQSARTMRGEVAFVLLR